MLGHMRHTHSQIAGPFLELVRSLRVLHLQPQCHFSSEASGNAPGSSSSSTSGDAGQGVSVDSFNRRVAALQEGQAQARASAWLRADAARQQPGSSGSSALGQQPDSSYSRQQAGSGEGGEGLQAAVHPVYGYAVLGGVDPSTSQLVAGATQPKLHPTRNFSQQDVYDPTDLSPLAVEEEESWVPQFRRGPRERPVSSAEVRAELDYKNIDLLLQFVSASGRIKPRRATKLKPRLQSRVARTVKLARSLALIPYEMRVGDGGEGDTWRRMREFRKVSQGQSSGGSSV